MDPTEQQEFEHKHSYILHVLTGPEVQKGQDGELPGTKASPRLSTIRETAREFGVSVRMIRYYEDLAARLTEVL